MKVENQSLEFLVDYVLPELTPYEFAVFILLLRSQESGSVTIGKRTIAARLGKGVRGKITNFEHISSVLNCLEGKGFITIGDTGRDGTIYRLADITNIPAVAARLVLTSTIPTEPDDYFNDPQKRLELFERDKWRCHYCGKLLTQQNATLDHIQAQSKGGKHSSDNLVACCLECNAIKNGRSVEEAAVDLLKRIGSNARKQS